MDEKNNPGIQFTIPLSPTCELCGRIITDGDVVIGSALFAAFASMCPDCAFKVIAAMSPETTQMLRNRLIAALN